MRLKILKSIAGDNFAFRVGQIVTVGPRLADDLVRSGAAEVLEETPGETATIEPGTERPTQPRARRRRIADS